MTTRKPSTKKGSKKTAEKEAAEEVVEAVEATVEVAAEEAELEVPTPHGANDDQEREAPAKVITMAKPLALKMARVMSEVRHVPKNGRNDFHGYDFYAYSSGSADRLLDLGQRPQLQSSVSMDRGLRRTRDLRELRSSTCSGQGSR